MAALVRLSAALFAEDAGRRDPLTDQAWPGRHGYDHFSDLVFRGDAVCLLALCDQRPVGYLAGLERRPSEVRPARVAELQSMYVEPEHRDRDVGTELVGRFRLWAAELGADRMAVTAYASNEAALRFYERAGFRPRTVTWEAPP